MGAQAVYDSLKRLKQVKDRFVTKCGLLFEKAVLKMHRASRIPKRNSNLLDPGQGFLKQDLRLSRNENRRTNRASSTSRISNPSCTPSFRRSKSQASLKRTPQSVQSIRNRSSERQKVKKKDGRPIQDKKWQADMLYKTQEYFQNDPEGGKFLNQGKNLRPITITMFIQLVNIVLNNIDNNFEELTTINYVDLLPKHLTRLMYPGVVTASMMKTVNTMHTWPHILAILSWLVETHIMTQHLDNFIDENMYILPNSISDKEYQELQILQLEDKFLTASFVKWNEGQKDTVDYDNFAAELREIYGIDENKMHQWRQKVDKVKTQLEYYKEKITRQKYDIEKVEDDIEKLLSNKNYIDTHISQQKEYIKKLEKKIKECKSSNLKLKDLNEKKIEQIKMLEEKIKLQPMSKQEEKMELLRIEELKVKRDLMLKEQKYKQQISDEMDIRISQFKRKIEEKVSTFNIELLEPSLKHPELKEFKIETMSVIGSEFFEEVQSKIKKLEEFKTDLLAKLKKERRGLVLANEEYLQVTKEIEEVLNDKKEMQIRIDAMNEKIESAKAKFIEEEDDKLKIIESLKQKIIQTKAEFPDVNALKEKCKHEMIEYEKLKKKWENDGRNMLDFFKKLEIEVVQNIVPRYRQIREQLTIAVLKQTEELKELKDLQIQEHK